MLRIFWKEWRENWALFLSLLLAGEGLLYFLRAMGVVGGPGEDWLVCQFIIVMLPACLGASLVGPEVERGTLELLFSYPVPRWRIWAGKALFGLPVSFALGLALALTVNRFGGSTPDWVPPTTAWPFESAMAFAAAFAMSGVVRGSLVAAMLGIGYFGAVAALVCATSLRLTIFFPVAIAGVMISSGCTFMTALSSKLATRVGALALGALAGLVLFPPVFVACVVSPEPQTPLQPLAAEDFRPVPGKTQIIVQVPVTPPPLRPWRSPGGFPWREGGDKRLLRLDVATGERQWLPQVDFVTFDVTGDGRAVYGRAIQRDGSFSASANYWTMEVDGSSKAPAWDAEHWEDGPAPVISIDSTGQLLNRSAVSSKYRNAAYAGMLKRGIQVKPIKPGESPDVVVCASGGGKDLLQYGYSWSRLKSADSSRWLLDTKAGTFEPVVPTDAAGKPLPETSFVQRLSTEPARWEIFVDMSGAPGVCHSDGSSARMLDLGGKSKGLWEPTSALNIAWSADGDYAVAQVGGVFQDDPQERWYVDALHARASLLPAAPEGLRVNLDWMIPMAGGVYSAALGGDTEEWNGLRCRRVLLWFPADGSAPQRQSTDDNMVCCGKCWYHQTTHPFWLQRIPVPTSGTNGVGLEFPTFRQCVSPNWSMSTGEGWRLIALAPPSAGGPVSFAMEEKVPKVPGIVMRGQRALLRREETELDILDWSNGKPERKQIRSESGPAAGAPVDLRWLTDRYAVESNGGHLWLVDADELTRKHLYP